jgi:hypothetical protein
MRTAAVRQCGAMEPTDLGKRVRELLDGGGGEAAAGTDPFVPLVTLDSGARCGLDREAVWLFVAESGRAVRYAPATAHLFHEVLEQKRRRFDDAVEEAARALGLPAEQVLFSFPAVDVIRAVLAKEHPYLTRLALEWIAPTELRTLRAEIRAVTRVLGMPLPVKELAERLVVPE